MMGFILVAVAVLGFLSGGQSAPVTSCDTLTQIIQIQGREQLLGKWMSLAESSNVTGSQFLAKKLLKTYWVKITPANESNTIDVLRAQETFGTCAKSRSTMTLENNTLSMVRPMTVSEVLLNTGCPDCLVISSKHTSGQSTYRGLQFLSRRNKVTAAEKEEFKKQAKCLNFPSPVFVDSVKGLCPDESPSQQRGNTDDHFSKIIEILSNENVVIGMLEFFFNTVTESAEN